MPFTLDQQLTMLRIARRALEDAVCSRPAQLASSCDGELEAMECGVFVTIHTNRRLRGCIGRFQGDRPLPQLVALMAASAATQDPRFTNDRLQPDELRDCQLEISVLSPMERIANPLDFEIGLHGIYVRQGNRSGCFLPQVGPEAGWSAETMLSQCCARKAGLDADAWRNGGDIEVFRFTAEVIEETHDSEQTPRSFNPIAVQRN